MFKELNSKLKNTCGGTNTCGKLETIKNNKADLKMDQIETLEMQSIIKYSKVLV